jgi:hypothetical protein
LTNSTVDSLSSGLRGVAEDLWASATAGEQPSARLRARWWSMRDIHAIATTFEQLAQAFRAGAGMVLAGKDPKGPVF